jgi:hypothetical protein
MADIVTTTNDAVVRGILPVHAGSIVDGIEDLSERSDRSLATAGPITVRQAWLHNLQPASRDRRAYRPPARWHDPNPERQQAFRAHRTFSIDEINDMDVLPERLSVDELKNYGLVNLVHTTNKKTEPWLRAGFYKFLEDGRLWVIEVCSTVVKGSSPAVWILKPIIRVRAETAELSSEKFVTARAISWRIGNDNL